MLVNTKLVMRILSCDGMFCLMALRHPASYYSA
ncbi:hypothetical protein LTSESEN_1088, partial [Salmonella enterica subsp. enterica serovar Senftenberg str. A4-543]